MHWKSRLAALCQTLAISRFDFLVLTLLLVGGMLYLHDCFHWGIGWVGQAQYGDAEFWWDGALHIAQGIFQDNPGKGYRPGYFILTGLTLPVLGAQFKQYYPYLILAFLATSGLFYLALRQPLGRWVAACVVAMLVFNPFTAEWLATSTSDGTGLILNLAALACLLFGINNGLRLSWLAAFSVLFALATLTRPLVTPFICVVLLALLVLPKEPFKKRLNIVACILIAFWLPMLLWMSIQKLTIDRWAISSNDASAFYAASDPAIQVWTPTMYDHIQQLAAQRYHIDPTKIDNRLLNQMFWQETVKNYIKYPKYHLSRIAPHIWEIARFAPSMAPNGTDLWRTILLDAIAAGMLLWFLLQRRWLRALLFAALGISIVLSPQDLVAIMTLVGAVLALALKRSHWKNQLGIFLLSAYWLTGVAALYLVGGTWGPPSFSPLFALNALGYRLGSQIFFAGDLLAAYFLVWLAYFKLNVETQSKRTPTADNLYRWWQFVICRPSPLAGKIVLSCFGLFLTLTAIVYLIGGSIVVQRSYIRNHTSIKPYPALNPIMDMYRQHSGDKVIHGIGDKGGLDAAIFTKAVKADNADVVFTGTVSAFIWNMPGQQRAQLMVYSQQQVRPYTMGPEFIFLDIPQHVDVKNWLGVQGAFIIRQVPDKHNLSNQAYYLTTPAMRAFVPLATDGKSFALAKTIWFPLTKNATQLATDNELKFKDTKVTWAQDSGQAPFQRRFFITPQIHNHALGKTQLILNVAAAHGPATLNFSYAAGDIPGVSHSDVALQRSLSYYDINVFIIRKGSAERQRMFSDRKLIQAAGTDTPLTNVKLPLPANTLAVEIVFNNLAPGTGIWLYEFNLTAADFAHRATKNIATSGDE